MLNPQSNKTVAAAVFRGEDLGRCDAAHGQVRVSITRIDNDPGTPGDETDQTALADHGFIIWFLQA